MTGSLKTAKQNQEALAKLSAGRVAAGRCRHCGGPVPCMSYFGDQRVGVRHSDRSYNALRARRGMD